MPKLDLDTIDCRIITELQADARLSKGWSVEGRISNALGRTYYTAAAIDNPPTSAYYNQPGRELDLTLRYRFEESPSAP